MSCGGGERGKGTAPCGVGGGGGGERGAVVLGHPGLGAWRQ